MLRAGYAYETERKQNALTFGLGYTDRSVGFDLSQGAVVALTSVTSALVMVAFKDTFANEPGLIILVGVLAGLGCGVIVGLVNGLCVAFLRISPFMVTLGTMSIATGFALLLTSGIPVYGMPKSYVEGFGRGLLFDLPTAFYLAAAVVADKAARRSHSA